MVGGYAWAADASGGAPAAQSVACFRAALGLAALLALVGTGLSIRGLTVDRGGATRR